MKSRDSLLLEAIRVFDVTKYAIGIGAAQVQSDEWVVACPTCGKEKLTINTTRKAWHCWVCQGMGARGKGGLVDLIQIFDRVSRTEAVAKLVMQAQYTPTQLSVMSQETMRPDLAMFVEPAQQIEPPDFWHPVDGSLPYLARRGITVEDVKAFGLFWCSAGRYANRLVFPVWEEGRLVHFQARAMWDESERPGERYIKALNPPATEGAAVSSDVLMNLDTARQYPRVAIVEGPIDCVKAGPSAVCTFGKKISAMQIAKLVRAGVQAVDLCWDGPSEREPHGAWPEMFHTAPQLAGLFDTRLVFLPSGDPGEKTRAELDWLREHASRPAAAWSRMNML